MRTRSGLMVFTFLALMMLIAPPLAQAQDLLWVKQLDHCSGFLAVDRSHNVYRVGGFTGTADFDPGPGTFELTPSGAWADVFVSKLDRDGRFLWAGQLGGTGRIFAYNSAVDDDGNVYIFGFTYEGTYDLDPGPGTFELTTINYDAYVCKLDSSGNFVWAITFDHSAGGGSAAISGTVEGDHVYTVGDFHGTVDFDPGPGTFEMTSDEGRDFVSMHDSTGNFVWAGQIGALPRGVAVHPNGDVYTIGFFTDTNDFDPGPGTFFLTPLGDSDGFVSRLDSAGNFVWAGQLGGPNRVRPWEVVVDSKGDVYTAGRFTDTVDFDPGPGTFYLTSSQETGFVCKLDSAGNFVWAGQLGGNVRYANGIVALDSSDNVYNVGSFCDTADFDPGPGTFFLTSFGGCDAFVSKLDSAGNFVWAGQLGGALGDSASVVTLDSSDNLYTGGGFGGTANFDPGPGTFFLDSVDGSTFIWKFGFVDIRLESQDPTSIHFSPDSPSLSFDVATGLLSELQADRDFDQATCLGTYSGNPATDDSVPPVGEAFYYLARGRSCCTTQGYGDSTLIPDPRDDLNLVSPCP